MKTKLGNETSRSALKNALEHLLETSDLFANLENDPVGIVREFAREDQEVVGLIASSLAYGRVTMLRRAIRDVLGRLGEQPTQKLLAASDEQIWDAMDGFRYRMSSGEDVADLLIGVHKCLHEFGSLEACYLHAEGSHLEKTSELVRHIRDGRMRTDCSRGLRYLLPDPLDGSTTKRLHLFLRWMVRPDDGVDLGLWTRVSPADLLMPLDTHTARIARYLGLTKRVSNDLKTVEEVSKALAELDENDPIRYDFALCHLGISTQCIHTFSEPHCSVCPVKDFCLHSTGSR